MTMTENFITEPERRLPVIRSVDVLVAGAGPAGLAAGVSAARLGARTLVLDRFGYVGGMMTGAYVVKVFGMGDGHRPLVRGFAREVRERLAALHAAMPLPNLQHNGDYEVDPEAFKWQMLEMLEESGAEILLHTMACAPILEDSRVRGVIIESKSGRQAIRAGVTIDCTADADLAFRAGCLCDNETHDVSLGALIEGVDSAAASAFEKEHPEEYRRIMDEALRPYGGRLPWRQWLKNVDITNAEALSRAECRLRRDIFRCLFFLRKNLPGWQNARVKSTWPQLGVRQSRRIRGEYTLTDQDLLESRHFDDAVARLGIRMVGYKLYQPAGLNYDVPYRCLLPRDVEGLLVAGRCVSADYPAENSLRLLAPCFATGQAAGVAAALAAQHSVTPRRLDRVRLREALRRQDVNLEDVGTPPGEPERTDGPSAMEEDAG